jgi:hypothetical protein
MGQGYRTFLQQLLQHCAHTQQSFSTHKVHVHKMHVEDDNVDGYQNDNNNHGAKQSSILWLATMMMI